MIVTLHSGRCTVQITDPELEFLMLFFILTLSFTSFSNVICYSNYLAWMYGVCGVDGLAIVEKRPEEKKVPS